MHRATPSVTNPVHGNVVVKTILRLVWRLFVDPGDRIDDSYPMRLRGFESEHVENHPNVDYPVGQIPPFTRMLHTPQDPLWHQATAEPTCEYVATSVSVGILCGPKMLNEVGGEMCQFIHLNTGTDTPEMPASKLTLSFIHPPKCKPTAAAPEHLRLHTKNHFKQ